MYDYPFSIHFKMQFFAPFRFTFPYLLGAFTVLAFAPFYVYTAAILSLIGLIYLWIKTDSAKSAFKLGFQYGLGLYVVGIYWIYISLHDFGGMPWWFAGFSTFCLCAFMSLFVGAVGYLSKRFGFIIISAPVLWGLSDWVRSWIFTGFPWLTLGYSQVPYSPLAGYMPVFGVYGVSVITALVATIIACWLTQVNFSAAGKRNAVVSLVLILTVGNLLKAVEWTTPIGKPVNTALIQGNIAQDTKWSAGTAQNTINTYIDMVKQSQAQLIVLPETALPVVSSRVDSSIIDALSNHAKQNNGDVIVGMVELNEKTEQYFNSAFSFGTAPIQSYAKNHLVPFGEFIPLKQVFGWIYRDWLNMPLSDLSRGGAYQTPMQLGNQKIAVNVCYEDVFGEEIIRQLPAATLLVNISNDAWYGQSYAADQHMQFSQARALETGRMMLRATNTGATSAIDSHGYVITHAPHDVQTTLNVVAQGYTGSTPYVRWGNWPFIVLCFAALTVLVWRKRSFLR